jgi:hypothetical protein
MIEDLRPILTQFGVTQEQVHLSLIHRAPCNERSVVPLKLFLSINLDRRFSTRELEAALHAYLHSDGALRGCYRVYFQHFGGANWGPSATLNALPPTS